MDYLAALLALILVAYLIWSRASIDDLENTVKEMQDNLRELKNKFNRSDIIGFQNGMRQDNKNIEILNSLQSAKEQISLILKHLGLEIYTEPGTKPETKIRKIKK